MRASRGFTLLEMMVTVGIIAILATIAVPTMRAARRNATVQSTAFEVALRIDGLRARAMRDQQDLVAILVDAPGNNPAGCRSGNLEANCVCYYLLAPQDGFTLNAFSTETPTVNALHVEHDVLGHGLKFYLPAAGRAAPPPFNTVSAFDGELVGSCNGRQCVAIRFRSDGEVSPEYPTGATGNPKLGLAFVFGSDVDAESAGSDQRGVVVTFPTGLVRAYPVAR
jgi:prepilin-type N-terminal cleavage/methylation domain-containing protein